MSYAHHQAITIPAAYPRFYVDLVDQRRYPRRGLSEVQGPPRFSRSYRVVREESRYDAISVATTDDRDLACKILVDEMAYFDDMSVDQYMDLLADND